MPDWRYNSTMNSRPYSVVLILSLFILAACSQPQELPTQVPTAVAPTQQALTSTPLVPPTRDISQPTLTPMPSPTPVSIVTETPITINPEVNITSPSAGVDLLLGSQAPVGGLAQIGTGQILSVTLASATGHLLASTLASVSEVNSWETTLQVPESVSGPAEIRASIIEDDGAVLAVNTQPVNLTLDAAASDRYLALFRPVNGDSAVSSFNLYFDGRTQLPANNQITISLWNDECQAQVARQTFALGGSGYWWGLINIPANVTGTICAAAQFGTPGDDSWREAQVKLNVLDQTEESATGVFIGQPLPGAGIEAGNELNLRGTAYNAPNNEVFVSILLENGRILTEGVAIVDDQTFNGFWELALFVPDNAEGPAQISASIGQLDEDGYAQDVVGVEIQAAPE
jgi:hypothetical protein